MAGGTFTAQNKVRPGVYIDIISEPASLGAVGERGITSLALSLPWGVSGTIITIQAGDDTKAVLGYDLNDPEMLLIREALKRAKTLQLYRLNTGVKATAASGNLTATAVYGGIRGNDIRIVIQTNIDNSAMFDVITYFAGDIVQTQTVANIAGLVSNAWVVFSGTGTLAVTAGVPLIGGANGTITNANYTAYLALLELIDFDTLAYTGTDASLKAIYAAFVRRLRENEGKKVQVVMENYPSADYEGVISIKNGVKLFDGTVLTAAQASAWVAAATAAAGANQSLTYQAYDDAIDAGTRYTNAQIEAALTAGEFLFVLNSGKAVIEQDINSLTSFTPQYSRVFAKNRVIRVFDGLANDIQRIFQQSYIGKISNNANGRSLLQGEIISYLRSMQNMNAIQNFDAQTDVIVSAGEQSDSVYVEVFAQPIDSIEKIYMKVRVS
ncbi:hypothetical protein Back11_12030 [Paenibacillus baekrokdamisoli]|uniref:Uncharacterized protein n=1 Tax=Paenibacillus baekrokdamisoli TaxID=1712516 RepID=A0A3G9J7Q6_9BACL|nr:phage tail sheath family protein [Paenibacillus baekrokdamisoli]MBB3070508.1 hypothetical protein [Paenibacillus baekrokdamisoli]BBH19858.1 hypothetical protein Back11_12030 [Paenibacillus baekrokdamisoli]